MGLSDREIRDLIPPQARVIVEEQDEDAARRLERELITNTFGVQATPDATEVQEPEDSPLWTPPGGGDWEGEGDISADAYLAALIAEIGTVESPPNSNRTKYGKAYGMDGVAWCAMFVSWGHRVTGSLHMCNFSTPGGYAYTPAGADGFRKRGQWGTNPRRGAHVFYRFPGGPARIHHVGAVIDFSANWIEAVEGNTSPGTGGSQRDGGGVFRRRRSSGIVGYGYPAFGNRGAAAAPAPAPGAPAGPRPILRRGSTGEWVKFLKRRLNAHSPASRHLDPNNATFGPTTELRVRQFQEAKFGRAGTDGEVGPQTWGALG